MKGSYSNGNGPLPMRTAAGGLLDIPGVGGTLAGIGGGLAMIVVAALLTAAAGEDVWREPREIAQPLFGAGAAGAAPVVAGTILHFLMAALFGAGFSLISRRLLRLPSDYGVPVLAGLIYGLMLWVLAYFVVLPILNPVLLDTYAPSFIIQHLVYGMVTGLIYARLRPAPYARSGAEQARPRLADW